jgi:hypothetical protein
MDEANSNHHIVWRSPGDLGWIIFYLQREGGA